MKSKFFNLNWRDFLKGSIVAILIALGTALATPSATVKSILLASLIGFISYLTKNLFTNQDDKLLKK